LPLTKTLAVDDEKEASGARNVPCVMETEQADASLAVVLMREDNF
jgi:hypothetical protein